MSATIAAVDDPIARARDAAMPNAADVATYRKYVLGDHTLTLTDRMKVELSGLIERKLCDNLCRLAVQAATDFLELQRIDILADDSTEKQDLAAFLDELWTLNQMDELSSDVHFAAYRDGNYAVVLDWDKVNERVRLHQHDWWNGQRGTWVKYGKSGLPEYAVAEWAEDVETRTIAYRTVWYPDRIERFWREFGFGAWEMRNDPEDQVQGGHPVPWVDGFGDPIGIPVVHFPNLLIPNHQPGVSARELSRRYGLSILAGGAIGVQDGTNDALYSFLGAVRRRGFPIIYGTGITQQLDPVTRKPIDIAIEPGAFLSNPSVEARFGVLDSGDMSESRNAIVELRRTFARMTNSPMQIVAETDKDAASGVALQRQQMSAVRQARRGSIVFGNRWGMVGHKAAQMRNAFAGKVLNAELLMVGEYAPIEASDLTVMAEVAQQLKDAGFPMRFIAKQLGMTPEQIDELIGWIEEEAGMAADQFQRGFNQQVEGAAASARRDAGGGGTGEGSADSGAAA